ncbi:Hypothetical protein LUCI_4329 [Lucifera butyrica]|uniref:Uncharacterized protein n=1 Tax=Lucifera butyrica TaxID=1351585 RepID=A0A498RG27_9FIRM|nr:hypothetical protein [Lucifera butyrica]VBB09043.1 Hypothetical protein LUCI_4329 [Lucifera butyrica]
MKHNKPLTAGILGAVSTITGEVVTKFLTWLGFGKYSIYQLISMTVTLNRPTEIIGLIVNFILGGFIGIAFYYSLILIGRDYLVLKSTAVSLFFWFLAEIIFTAIIEGHFIAIRPISDYYVHLSGAIAYGVTVGLLFKVYIFNENAEGTT